MSYHYTTLRMSWVSWLLCRGMVCYAMLWYGVSVVGGGRLPLHIAVDRNNPSVEVVRAVIRGYPGE